MNGCFWKSGLHWQIYRRQVIPEFHYPFKAFGILNFDMTECFFFLSKLYYIFVIKKHTSSEMLSFLHRWNYSWKCEFDTDIKIEQKIIITMMENNKVFIKKVHIKTQSKKKDVLVIFALQETKSFNLFGKNCTQENVQLHIQHGENWLRGIVIEQVNCK